MVKIQRLPSGSYRARVHLGGGKYKSITGKDKKDVQLRAAQLEAEIESQSGTDDNPYINTTVAEAMEKYVEAKKNVLSPKTYREYTQTRKNSLKMLHNIPLYELTQEQIQQAVNIASADHAPKTVRNMYGLLSSTLKMFRPNFSLNTTLPQRKKPDIVIPTEEDIVKLFAYTKGTDIEIPVLLAAVCGMRMSEIIGLRWSAVDLEKQIIKVEAAKVRDINNNLVMKGTKSVAGQRSIKLLPAVTAALEKQYNADKEFVTDLSSNNIYDRYQKALAVCCPGKHYTFHELRHYAASVMIMLGIPVKYIADYLGHETEDMVNRVYGHIMMDKKDEMYSRLDGYYKTVFKKI